MLFYVIIMKERVMNGEVAGITCGQRGVEAPCLGPPPKGRAGLNDKAVEGGGEVEDMVEVTSAGRGVMRLVEASILWSDLLEHGGEHAEAALQFQPVQVTQEKHMCARNTLEITALEDMGVDGVAQVALAMHGYLAA